MHLLNFETTGANALDKSQAKRPSQKKKSGHSSPGIGRECRASFSLQKNKKIISSVIIRFSFTVQMGLFKVGGGSITS